jgi:hypothetical protein
MERSVSSHKSPKSEVPAPWKIGSSIERERTGQSRRKIMSTEIEAQSETDYDGKQRCRAKLGTILKSGCYFKSWDWSLLLSI